MSKTKLLKKDLLGEIWQVTGHDETLILRDARPARWWLRWLATGLLQREARALAALINVAGIPQLHSSDKQWLLRTFLPGEPLFLSEPDDAAFFKDAARLLRRIHRAGVAHNDLAKEPNVLVLGDASAAFIDFQLAWFTPRRGRLFRAAAREDIRHLLKHKRTYRPDLLTVRERAILNSPAALSRAWRLLIKPIYWFVTRKLLGWSDREGAAER